MACAAIFAGTHMYVVHKVGDYDAFNVDIATVYNNFIGHDMKIVFGTSYRNFILNY